MIVISIASKGADVISITSVRYMTGQIIYVDGGASLVFWDERRKMRKRWAQEMCIYWRLLMTPAKRLTHVKIVEARQLSSDSTSLIRLQHHGGGNQHKARSRSMITELSLPSLPTATTAQNLRLFGVLRVGWPSILLGSDPQEERRKLWYRHNATYSVAEWPFCFKFLFGNNGGQVDRKRDQWVAQLAHGGNSGLEPRLFLLL